MDQEDYQLLKERIDLKVQIEDYSIQQLIDRGGWGSVYRAVHRPTGSKVAIKIIPKIRLILEKQVDHLYRQLRCLAQIKNQFCIKGEGFCQKGPFLFLVLQLVESHPALGVSDPSFYTFLNSPTPNRRLQSSEARFYSAELVLAIKALHNKGYIHRDIRPENIALDSEGHIKLIDFGFSRKCHYSTMTFCGTFQYMAPQVVNRRAHGKGVDWWALGVLIFQMLQGSQAFGSASRDPIVIFNNINNYCNKTNSLQFKFTKPQQRALILALLQPDVTKRLGITFDSLRLFQRHQFFNKVKFQQILKRKVKTPLSGLCDKKIKNSPSASARQGAWYQTEMAHLKQCYGAKALLADYSQTALLP